MKHNYEDLKRTLTRVFNYLGIHYKLDVFESYDDSDAVIFNDKFIIGFDPVQNSWFLQGIVHFGGSYFEPPSEDYIDLAEGKLKVVIGKLVESLVDEINWND